MISPNDPSFFPESAGNHAQLNEVGFAIKGKSAFVYPVSDNFIPDHEA